MDSVINAAATENNYALVYGDIAKAYVVALGVGSVMEMGVQAYGANGRPATARHAFMWTRIGAEVVNIAAARLLDIPTTA